MAIAHKDIRLALRGLMLAVSGIPSSRAYENLNHNPPDPTSGNSWLRETYLPGDQRRVANNLIEAVGVIQFDLFWPTNTGTNAIEDKADDIMSALRPGKGTGTDNLHITRAQRLRGRPDGAWYMVPVEIHWRFYGTND